MKRHWEIVLFILAMALWPLSRLAAAQELERLAIATIEIMGSRNPKIARLKPQDVLDTSILERLEQSGSIRSESAKQ
jgi:hypothetical protein